MNCGWGHYLDSLGSLLLSTYSTMIGLLPLYINFILLLYTSSPFHSSLLPLSISHFSYLLRLNYLFNNTNYNMASKHTLKDPVINRNKRVKISDDMIVESLKKPRFMPPYFEHDALDPNLYAGGM